MRQLLKGLFVSKKPRVYPIKCTSIVCPVRSFHKCEIRNGHRKYIISLPNKKHIRIMLAGIINKSQQSVRIQISDFSNREDPTIYSGKVGRKKLHKLMSEFEDALFYHGHHSFTVEVSETGERISFDDHGLLILETKHNYSRVLHGLRNRLMPKARLISQYDHFHYCLANGKERLMGFVAAMKLHSN